MAVAALWQPSVGTAGGAVDGDATEPLTTTEAVCRLVWLPLGGAMERQGSLTVAERERLRTIMGMLGPRQCQVAKLMLAGCSLRRMADSLGLSDSTIKTHVRRIRQRMRTT